MKVVTFFLCVFALSSCANLTQSVSENGSNILDGPYQLMQVKGKNVADEDMIFNFLAQENRVFGDTGCNGFAANFKQDGQKVDFIAPLSTKKLCKGKMEIEKAVLDAIMESKTFQQADSSYTFYTEKGTALFQLIKKKNIE